MNILILDDTKLRHERFAQILADHNLFHAYTFKEGQKIIRDNDIHMACLDHDLDEEYEHATFYVNENNEKKFYNGADFALWLSAQDTKIPKKILIHSWNPQGAENIKNNLSKLDNVEVVVRPFNK